MKFARRNFNPVKKGRDWCVGDISPKGQTLIELIVVLGIFIMLVSSVSGIFISIINAERRALAIQEVLNNTRYTIEIMARAIRQADPDPPLPLPSACAPCNTLQFKHPDAVKGIMQYSLSSGRIEEDNASSLPFPITPSNVKVERLSFRVLGSEIGAPYEQPRVIISLRIGAQPNANPAMDIETTVSLRTMQE